MKTNEQGQDSSQTSTDIGKESTDSELEFIRKDAREALLELNAIVVKKGQAPVPILD